MRIAITGSESVLAGALSVALSGENEVVSLPADPRDRVAASDLLAGVDSLIHLDPIAPAPDDSTDQDLLDRAGRGTYVLLTAAVEHRVRRVVLGSSLSLLERYPASWAVSETWRPRPDVTDARQLAAHVAEHAARQFVFFSPLQVVCLRFGEIVDPGSGPVPSDWRAVHVADAVTAVEKALTAPLRLGDDFGPEGFGSGSGLDHGWRVYHIPGAGNTRIPLAEAQGGLGYEPEHDLAPDPLPAPTPAEEAGDLSLIGPRSRIPSRTIRRVVIFGAGGPLAASAIPVLAPSYQLHLTDLRSVYDVIAAGPQSEGAPLPAPPSPPHSWSEVDVTDFDQVMRATEGADAVINCTVLRNVHDPAFLVNFIGAYNVMRAAVANGIRRVVHTGPLQVASEWPAGYGLDFDVPPDAPGRSGGRLYGHSKILGQEIVRLFADAYDLEVPVLLFTKFVDPATAKPQTGGVHPMSISWADAGEAMRHALEIPTLPSPFELFHITTRLPQGKYPGGKAERLLEWRPRDDLHHLWARRP
jgi:nucleoside-diphosphate-sugar epimerase